MRLPGITSANGRLAPLWALGAGTLAVLLFWGCDRQKPSPTTQPAPATAQRPEPEPEPIAVTPAVEALPESDRITFNRDVAPILFANCSSCHRPGASAPFNLLSYADARRRARFIAKVADDRIMPPWLPTPGHVPFKDERRLTDQQIATLQKWIEHGAIEGKPEDLPKRPEFADGWQLGQPDLVVTMPEAYTVPAEGTDVYRNFVIPVPTDRARYVKAVEFRPGNPRVVHHTYLWGDPVQDSRRLDAKDPGTGYGGMEAGEAIRPLGGQINSWNPGSSPRPPEPGIGWQLRKGMDLVLQAHLRPLGKPEPIQASIGLYFTDEPPARSAIPIWLFNYAIDIPADAPEHVVQDSFVLPADVEVRTIKPHAHYLCDEMLGTATLPDGKTVTLLHIKHWNFDWQEAYRLVEPLHLPKGTTLTMRYTYNNSSSNPRNPNAPPRRVRFGPSSSDEMAELHFEVMASGPQESDAVVQAQRKKLLYATMDLCNRRIADNPADADSYDLLGRTMQGLGFPREALRFFTHAVGIRPAEPEFRDHLGVALYQQGEADKAEAEFREVLRLDPSHPRAHNRLGVLALARKDLPRARGHFESALKVTPGDALILNNLGLVEAESGNPREAVRYFKQAVAADPEYAPARENLRAAPR